MASSRSLLLIFSLSLLLVLNPNRRFCALSFVEGGLEDDEYSILKGSIDLYRHDYSPPAPPPPLPPYPPPSSCELDLDGIGSFDTLCQLRSNLDLSEDIYVKGKGSFEVLDGVRLTCPVVGCAMVFNLSGDIRLKNDSLIVAGSVFFESGNVSIAETAVVNVTALGGDPPSQTSGSPHGTHGDGGGYGGRGASCFRKEGQTPDDNWGGDAYGWAWLMHPDSYGSRGGSTSREVDYGGGGGGRVRILVKDTLELKGVVSADGGDGGLLGGGGSGGSLFLTAYKMKGNGIISASGGNGVAGGGGGRVSIDVFSRHDESKIYVHGGRSYSCPNNNGAAGTLYDTIPMSLTVNNYNLSTETDTLLMEFPNKPLWTNVFVKNNAKVVVPLLWSRVQVQGQLSISGSGILSFGLTRYPYSEFELMAEELLVSDSTVRVFGALRMSIKMLLMWNSKILIDGGGETIVATSLLEASNLIVLKGASLIHSNANLGVHGQGLLTLSGQGDVIEAQRLILSLFYSVQVGPGSVLRGPLINSTADDDMAPRLNCDAQVCPVELLHPPEDCNVNSSLPFTLQICRVEDISVEGTIQGNVVHFHRARSVTVLTSGTITASGLGCKGGIGQGMISANGLGGGGGYGGKGGYGSYNGTLIEGGVSYGNADLPCSLGSGSGNDSIGASTSGGGIIVIGSMEHTLSNLYIYGSIATDGESSTKSVKMLHDLGRINSGGVGGGSGGTILLFLQTLTLGNNSLVSSVGGHGCPNGGGGGGGGRIHFHWSYISTGDDYVPIASVKGGNLSISGGSGHGHGFPGESGTVTGKACPKGLFGVFCKECPLGTFKNVSGSDEVLCQPCPPTELPRRAVYISVRGGVAETPCPYQCMSNRYHMPHCYTTLEELIYTFGGPWLFGLFLFGILIVLALVLSVARMKFVGADELPGPAPTQQGSQIDHSFPFLESLNEVLETNRAEESQNHVHRMYFMGSNTFSEPWYLPHSPPEQIKEIIYEDAFVRFVDEINTLGSYQWWEGAVYIISSILVYPLAWSWKQWRRKKKLQQLREFVRSEYDHSCLRSCRSRALYEGLKVAATPDLMLAYVDFFLGGDEKRPDLPPRLHQRYPLCLICGGDGSYMAPFALHSDNVLTSLMGQAVPPTTWYRLVAGLNARLRLVRRGCLRSKLIPVINWLKSHANPALRIHGISISLAWLNATALGYYQLGIVVSTVECQAETAGADGTDGAFKVEQAPWSTHGIGRENPSGRLRTTQTLCSHKNINGEIISLNTLRTLEDRRDILYPLSHIVRNMRPVGHQDLIGLVISILLLADFSLVILTFLQLYSYSLGDCFLVLFVLPLGLFLPFPAGINCLFSHGPRRSAALAHEYSLWNINSVVNVVVAFICGFVHYKSQSSVNKKPYSFQPWNWSTDESGWWIFPCVLGVCKFVQAQLVDLHVANLEIQDRSLYNDDPGVFWRS